MDGDQVRFQRARPVIAGKGLAFLRLVEIRPLPLAATRDRIEAMLRRQKEAAGVAQFQKPLYERAQLKILVDRPCEPPPPLVASGGSALFLLALPSALALALLARWQWLRLGPPGVRATSPPWRRTGRCAGCPSGPSPARRWTRPSPT